MPASINVNKGSKLTVYHKFKKCLVKHFVAGNNLELLPPANNTLHFHFLKLFIYHIIVLVNEI